jgi:hypothetical protein
MHVPNLYHQTNLILIILEVQDVAGLVKGSESLGLWALTIIRNSNLSRNPVILSYRTSCLLIDF